MESDKEENQEKKSSYEYEFKKDYISDWDIHRQYIAGFDAYEAMLLGVPYDTVSKSVDGGRISDSYATTLAKERADRVIAKLPEGQTMPTGKADMGKAAFMDILRQKWIYPNANAQYSFQEKLNMWEFYSSVYGYMPMFYDWNVSNTGYVGPDCWLWNPRNLIPQQGRVSIDDMEYVTALSWVSRKYLQNILDKKPQDAPEAGGTTANDGEVSQNGWDYDAIRELLDQADAKSEADPEKDTLVTRNRTPQSTKKGICLATRYESGPDGEWCVFAPDQAYVEIRRIDNPHKNGRIPFVINYSQPLFDSFYGLGDFQRAMPLQFARDGLTNFYFKGIKMNLIPPIVANANGVLKHTLDYREGAVMLETIPNSIRRLETSPAGLATYQGAMSNLTGSLLSLYGTQNASLPGAETLNPEQGKTPAAINMFSDKEATRDGAARRHIETAIQKLTDGFNSLLVNIGTEDIPVALFHDDIQDIVKSGLTDLTQMFENFEMDASGVAGDLKINPKSLKGVEYRFSIDPNSTAKVNKDVQKQGVLEAIGMISKMQNVFQNDPRLTVHWDKIMESYEQLSDIPNAGEWVTFDQNAPPVAPTPQQSPSATAVTGPGGQVHEAADLTKLYLGTADVGLQAQIIQALGFQPTAPAQAPEAPQGPSVSGGGMSFQDPHIASVADAVHNLGTGTAPPPPPVQTPNIADSGHVFHDPTIAGVASKLSAPTKMPPLPPEKKPVPKPKG